MEFPIEARCCLIVHEGTLIGVSLIAEGQSQAESFCSCFPREFIFKKSTIEIESLNIIFRDSNGNTCSFSLPEEYFEELRILLLKTSEDSLAISHDGILTPGFKITLDEKRKEKGERIKLTQLT